MSGGDPTKQRWPDYMPLPRDDIYAIGIIALNFCLLEGMFRNLLSAVTHWNQYEVAALFHRINNRTRLDILSDLIGKTPLPDETKGDVTHFADGYEKCTDNRNFIMHSIAAGQHSGGLVLQRRTRAGDVKECRLARGDLERIADEIHAFMTWGAWVDSDIRSFSTHFARGKPEEYRGRSPSTLREKPPLPAALNWQTPHDPKGQIFPHSASLLLQAFRLRDDP